MPRSMRTLRLGSRLAAAMLAMSILARPAAAGEAATPPPATPAPEDATGSPNPEGGGMVEGDAFVVGTGEATNIMAALQAYESLIKQNSRTLTLKEAERLALGYDLDLRTEIAGREVAIGQKMQAFNYILPSIQVGFTYQRDRKSWARRKRPQTRGRNVTDPLGKERSGRHPGGRGMQNAYYQSANLSQPLFQGGAIYAALRAANVTVEEAEENIRLARQTAIYNTRVAYYNVVLSRRQVEVSKRQVQYATEFMEKVRQQVRAEAVPQIEFLKAKVDLANSEATLIQDANNLINNRSDLARLIGVPLNSPLALVDDFRYVRQRIERESLLIDRALRNRPELRIAQLEERAQELAVINARSDLFPQVSMELDWSGNIRRFDWDQGKWQRDYHLGIQVDWMLFDGLLTWGEIKEAKATLLQQQFSRMDTEDEIRLDIRQSLANLRSADQFVRSQRENVDQAKRVHEQELIRYREGAGSYLEIIDARQSLATAEENYNQALYNYESALIQLELDLGQIGEIEKAYGKGEEDGLYPECNPCQAGGDNAGSHAEAPASPRAGSIWSELGQRAEREAETAPPADSAAGEASARHPSKSLEELFDGLPVADER